MSSHKAIGTCKNCNRTMQIAARGLCNTCYIKDVKNRSIITCKKCGEVKPHHSLGLCDRCYKNNLYHLRIVTERKRRREKYRENPEKYKEYDRARNKTQRRKAWQQNRNQQQYVANRTQLLEYQRMYRKTHPGFTTHHTEKYKARKAGLIDDLTIEQWNQILDEHHYACAYCGVTGVPLHREHKIPVSRGGGYTYSNIVPSCAICNNRKHTMTDVEFREFLIKFPR